MKMSPLVPTLRVGTDNRDSLCRRLSELPTQSVGTRKNELVFLRLRSSFCFSIFFEEGSS